MTDPNSYHIFLSYDPANLPFVEPLAVRLRDTNISFWFSPWHAIPGEPIQEQMEDALWRASACIVFIGGGSGPIQGWQNEEMRAAIQMRVEDEPTYRIIPVFLPGAARPSKRDLPRFLRRYFREDLIVEFSGVDDEQAFKRLRAGILGIAPIEVEGYLEAAGERVQWTEPPVVQTELPDDIFVRYEIGLRQFLGRLGPDHPGYADALAYRQRLVENIEQSRRYGDTADRKAERAEVIDRLNKLALLLLGVAFSDFCSESTSGHGTSF